jgi:hypothetical protein
MFTRQARADASDYFSTWLRQGCRLLLPRSSTITNMSPNIPNTPGIRTPPRPNTFHTFSSLPLATMGRTKSQAGLYLRPLGMATIADPPLCTVHVSDMPSKKRNASNSNKPQQTEAYHEAARAETAAKALPPRRASTP